MRPLRTLLFTVKPVVEKIIKKSASLEMMGHTKPLTRSIGRVYIMK
tara:strand:- start:241 stop:378 length:138 start_codon:yes stop_codon:yes gene_type:complete